MKIYRDPGCLVGYRDEHPVKDLRALTHCGEVYCSHDHSVPLHKHAVFEFMYVLSGTAFWQVHDTVFSQNQSELFWTLPGEPHRTASKTHQGYHKLWFGVNLADIDDEGAEVAAALQRLAEQGRRIIADAREMETVIRGLVLQVISQKARDARMSVAVISAHSCHSSRRQSRTAARRHTSRIRGPSPTPSSGQWLS